MADRKTSGNSSGRPDSSGGSRKYSYNKTSGRATAAKGKSEDNGKSSSGKSKAPQFEIKKSIFDPEGLLNQGVIFNDDPECFIKCLKPLPVLDFDFDKVPDAQFPHLKSTAQETIEAVQRANKCI